MKPAGTRGLTLLETLVASAILAMLASVCVPTLSAALRVFGDTAGNSPDAENVLFELSRLADKFLADPAMFNCKDLPRTIRQSPLTITWPEPAELTSPNVLGEVVVQVLPITAKTVFPAGPLNHLWLTFTSGDQVIVRYLALPEESMAP